jgi:hypothetical protein
VKLLVDAHALIWAVDDPTKLGPQALTALQDPSSDLLASNLFTRSSSRFICSFRTFISISRVSWSFTKPSMRR